MVLLDFQALIKDQVEPFFLLFVIGKTVDAGVARSRRV